MKHIKFLSLLLFAITGLSACAQKEIKDAFDQVNQNLVTTGHTIEAKNDSMYLAIKSGAGYAAISTKVEPARKGIYDYKGYIELLKTEMVKRAGGYDDNGGMVRKDDIDISTEMMIEEKRADTLFATMQEVKTILLSTTSDSVASTTIKTLLTPRQPPKQTLAEYYFHHIPVFAALTILTKLENDAVSVEGEFYKGVLRDMGR